MQNKYIEATELNIENSIRMKTKVQKDAEALYVR